MVNGVGPVPWARRRSAGLKMPHTVEKRGCLSGGPQAVAVGLLPAPRGTIAPVSALGVKRLAAGLAPQAGPL
jgi:hypothetical protein